MKLAKRLAVSFLLVSPSIAAQAQESSRVVHRMDSTHLDQQRTVTVQLPDSYASQRERAYPVLYLLDGESNLDYSWAVAEFLAQNGLVPETIVVAVHAGPTRGFDYAPEYVDRGGRPGRADRFLAFLEHELVPFVEDAYRAAPLRLISGHSLGGTLVTYVMVERPDLFRAFLTQSPYYDASIGSLLLERAEASFAGTVEIGRFFYMNLGAEPDLAPNFARMEELLSAAPAGGLEWVAEREPDKTHMTTRLVGHYEGLARFFAGDWPLDQQALMASGASALEAHIDALSDEYGYPVLYNEATFQQATQRALSQRDAAAATAFAELYVENYAESPIARFLLAVALATGGDREAAAAAIATAIDLHESNPNPAHAPVYEQMKQLRLQLTGH